MRLARASGPFQNAFADYPDIPNNKKRQKYAGIRYAEPSELVIANRPWE